MLRRLALIAVLLVLIAATWLANVAHLGVAVPPEETRKESDVSPEHGEWFGKEKYGVSHAFLFGDPFERGVSWGRLVRPLLVRQETALVEKLNEFFPSRAVQVGLVLLAKRWFWGIDSFIERDWKLEMYGVSFSAPPEYRSLGDPYTRQLAYHGLHEVGQLFVDYGDEGFACTVLAVPKGRNWLIGRNLDFEGGRIFDEEKIVKWVFPEKGYPFVSVIWGGMVGAVTGVNAKGVFISINAAGSKDFARLGTPSTFILLKALQSSANAEEAVEVFRREQTIITEIFVVGSPGSPLYVIEKSPKRIAVTAHNDPVAVANHLLDPMWAGDSVNEFRRTELTSLARLNRGNELVKSLRSQKKTATASEMVGALRDKRVDGALLPGNRSAIDALIATHGVIFDSSEGTLYVSKGPSLTGEFYGFDLAKSFAQKKPVLRAILAADKEIPPADYARIKQDIQLAGRLVTHPRSWNCDSHEQLLRGLRASFEHYLKYMALGLVEDRCLGKGKGYDSWTKARLLKPAYARERKVVEENLKLKTGIRAASTTNHAFSP